ncbi:MAG: hypothetical protein O3B43_01110 [Chloroflexi bacterium]|nr:hypothetical protein [Chloroflexota bacterium]
MFNSKLYRPFVVVALIGLLSACNYPEQLPTSTPMPTATETPIPTLVTDPVGVEMPPAEIAIQAFPHVETIDPELFGELAVVGYTGRFVVTPPELGISPYWVRFLEDVAEGPGTKTEYYASRSYEWLDLRYGYEYHSTINAYASPYELDQLFIRSQRDEEVWTVALDLPYINSDRMQYIVGRSDRAYTQSLRFIIGNYLVVVKTKNIIDYNVASQALEQMAQILISELVTEEWASAQAAAP